MARSSTSGQGRKPGVPNKITRPIRELAATFSEHAIAALVKIMTDATAPPAARVAAARELLDRAHGKPTTTTKIPLPKDGSLAEKGEAAIAAAAAGKLPLDHLPPIMSALADQAKLLDQSEILRRLEEVEKWLSQTNAGPSASSKTPQSLRSVK